MEILSWDEILQKSKNAFSHIALTIGVFDGVHRGHQTLLQRILGRKGETPWVLTFKSNPSKVLFPETYAGDLMTLRQKLEKIESFGIAGAVIIDFSQDFGRLKGADFFSMLWNSLPLSYLAVGEDFHCGNRMDTNAEKARNLMEPRGVVVEIVPPYFFHGAVVSSTRLRRSVLNGDVQSVKDMLGHPYSIDVSGLKTAIGERGTSLGKKNLSQVLPKSGTFPVVLMGPEGEKEGTLEIDEHIISWNQRGQVEAITFI